MWNLDLPGDGSNLTWVPKSIPTLIFTGEEDSITPLSLFVDSADFQEPNILIRKIKNAAHFRWLENLKEVLAVFAEYCQKLFNRSGLG